MFLRNLTFGGSSIARTAAKARPVLLCAFVLFSLTVSLPTSRASVKESTQNNCGGVFPRSIFAQGNGGFQQFSVTYVGGSTCMDWKILGNSPWLKGFSPNTGNVPGVNVVAFDVDPNTSGAPREGFIDVAFNNTFMTPVIERIFVTQSCVTVAQTQIVVPAAPSTRSIAVTAPNGACGWTATSNVPWITITSGATGAGGGTVVFNTRPNKIGQRFGTITIGGVAVTVAQDIRNVTGLGTYDPSSGNVVLRQQPSATFPDDPAFFYGTSGDIPIAGDWDGNGTVTIGIYRPSTSIFYLSNSNTTGFADVEFVYGSPGDVPIAGDWNGDGIDTIGVYRNGTFFLRNSNTAGFADIQIDGFGNPNDIPVVGDWDGNGTDTIGVFQIRANNLGHFKLRNSNTAGPANHDFQFGIAGDRPIAGDWNNLNGGQDRIGVYRSSTAQFFLRNSLSTGGPNLTINFGFPGNSNLPIAGDWDGIKNQ